MWSLAMEDPDELAARVDLTHSAVITIDIQNDFCHDNGTYRKAGLDVTSFQEMAVRVDNFLGRVRQTGIPVIHVAQIYTPWTMSPQFLQRLKMYNVDAENSLRPGSWGAEFYHIAPKEDISGSH